MAAKTKRRPLPADDFDESTPPPRVRPRGEPIPRHLTVPAGESVIGLFARWDHDGRIPAGSVLCDFRGSDLGKWSGYVVAANPVDGARVLSPLGPVGTKVKTADIECWYVRATIHQYGRGCAAVLSPPAEGTPA